MCGKILVCPESGSQGFLCRCVYIVEEIDKLKELYVCITLDRNRGCPVIIYGNWEGKQRQYDPLNSSQQGDVNHDQFKKLYIDIQQGLNVNMLQ